MHIHKYLIVIDDKVKHQNSAESFISLKNIPLNIRKNTIIYFGRYGSNNGVYKKVNLYYLSYLSIYLYLAFKYFLQMK